MRNLSIALCFLLFFAGIAFASESNPVWVNSYINATGLNDPRAIAISGNYLYVCLFTGTGLATFDISNKTNPAWLRTYVNATSLNNARGIAISGTYAYVVSRTGNSLTTFSLANPANPAQVAYYTNATSLGGANNIIVSGSYAYVADYTGNALTTFSLSNPASPAQTAYYNNATSLNGAFGLTIVGSYLYVSSITGGSVTTFSLSNPASPVQVAYYANATALNMAYELKSSVSGSYLYVVARDSTALTTLSLSNPASPSWVSTVVNASCLVGAYGVTINNNYAYVTSYTSNSLTTFSLANPALPVQTVPCYTNATALNGAFVSAMSGNHLYVIGYTGDVLTTFERDPASMTANTTAPTSNPNINASQTFILNITVNCSSVCHNVTVYPTYCTGSLSCLPNTDIPTSAGGLTSNVSSIFFATVVSGSPQRASFNITGASADNYTVGGRFVASDAGSNNTLSNQSVTVSLKSSSLLLWSDTNTTTKYPGNNTFFFANYTMGNGTIIDGTGVCQISFNVSGSWSAWANMTYNTSSTPYYYNTSFASAGTFNYNVSCSKANYVSQSLTSNFTITSLTGTNLSVWDQTTANRTYGNMTKHPGDPVAFYANYTNSTNNASLSGASCNITIYNGTAWLTPAAMAWNASISLFWYNYTAGFSEIGAFPYNITCNLTGYNTSTATGNVAISGNTNLSIWDQTTANRTYGNMTKHPGDPIAYYANYTNSSNNASLSAANCSIAIYNGTAWLNATNMTWNASISLFWYNFTTGFNSSGAFPYNITCNLTGYNTGTANGSATVSLRNSSLLLWSDTNTTTKYPGNNTFFFANYTMGNGTIIDGTGVCQISFNVSGSWSAWANMTYNTSSTPYYYNTSFASPGTFDYNVSCSKANYTPQTLTSNFTISTPGVVTATVSTGKPSYSGCSTIYYRCRIYNSTNALVNASFDIRITDPISVVRYSKAGAYPNNGTGIYLGNYSVGSAAVQGPWLIQALISGAGQGSVTFQVSH